VPYPDHSIIFPAFFQEPKNGLVAVYSVAFATIAGMSASVTPPEPDVVRRDGDGHALGATVETAAPRDAHRQVGLLHLLLQLGMKLRSALHGAAFLAVLLHVRADEHDLPVFLADVPHMRTP
jgi:hypothetical protein